MKSEAEFAVNEGCLPESTASLVNSWGNRTGWPGKPSPWYGMLLGPGSCHLRDNCSQADSEAPWAHIMLSQRAVRSATSWWSTETEQLIEQAKRTEGGRTRPLAAPSWVLSQCKQDAIHLHTWIFFFLNQKTRVHQLTNLDEESFAEQILSARSSDTLTVLFTRSSPRAN